MSNKKIWTAVIVSLIVFWGWVGFVLLTGGV